MERNRQKEIEVYRQYVFEGSSICTTYELLLRFVARLRSDLPKKPLNIVLEIFHQDIWIILTLLFMMNI